MFLNTVVNFTSNGVAWGKSMCRVRGVMDAQKEYIQGIPPKNYNMRSPEFLKISASVCRVKAAR